MGLHRSKVGGKGKEPSFLPGSMDRCFIEGATLEQEAKRPVGVYQTEGQGDRALEK